MQDNLSFSLCIDFLGQKQYNINVIGQMTNKKEKNFRRKFSKRENLKNLKHRLWRRKGGPYGIDHTPRCPRMRFESALQL